MKVLLHSCLLALALAAPAPDADPDADPQYLAAPYHAGHVVPAANCVTESEVFVTQTCTPKAEEVCSTETVETEEIEYEKVCKDVVDVLCDAPAAHHVYKREAEAEAEADADAEPYVFPANAVPYGALNAGHAVAPVAYAAPAPVAHHAPLVAAHAVAHSVTATVKHACREVVTEHCVDNPKIIAVPVEVEHCHTVTKVSCVDVNNEIPKTTCEQVETTHTAQAAYAAPVPVAHHVAPVAHHVAPVAAAGPVVEAYSGYAGHY